jgi:hypothetical protein
MFPPRGPFFSRRLVMHCVPFAGLSPASAADRGQRAGVHPAEARASPKASLGLADTQGTLPHPLSEPAPQPARPFLGQVLAQKESRRPGRNLAHHYPQLDEKRRPQRRRFSLTDLHRRRRAVPRDRPSQRIGAQSARYIIPPMSGMPAPARSFSGASATITSVVRMFFAIDAAFCSAERVTIVGSMMPTLTSSSI